MTEPKINHFLMPNVMNEWQDILALCWNACSQFNICEDCPYGGIEGKCDLLWDYLDDYALQHKSGGGLMMEYRIRQMQIKNTTLGKLRPKEFREEEVEVQCAHCNFQVKITLIDGRLVGEQKFAQVNGDIFHKCSDGVLRPCQKIGGKK